MAELSPTTTNDSSLLNRAVEAARSGDLARARTIAEDAVRNGAGEVSAFHAFLGMVCARLGDDAAATTHLEQAHRLKPDDVTIACNLISLLIDQERDAEALAIASKDLAKSDQSLRVARYRGFIAQKLEQYDAAIEAYELILDRNPDDFECWNNLGNARSGLADDEGALDALRRAIQLDPNVAPTRLNLATTLQALGKTDEAEAELVKASEDFPDDSRAPFQLYVHYKAAQRQDEAVEALVEAARRDPEAADLQLKLGIEYGVLRRTEDSEHAYRRTIELDPSELDAYLGLAIQFEHTNREDQFGPLIELARSNAIAPEPLSFIEALELRRLGRFEEALAKLDAVPAEVEPIRTVHARATVLERLKRTDQAFAEYSRANSLLQDNPTEPLDRAKQLRDQLRQEIAWLTPQWRDSWIDVEISDPRPDPVFLVGFPRSGTTLLDTILMGHPDTVVMEEQPPLNLVEEELGGMKAIPSLDREAISGARDRYFAEVEKIQPLVPGQLLIDKSPLFLYRLPLIKRIFPDARIILALRHPCDVVLSCFMSNFRLNSAMANFLRLEDAADFYDLCFKHWETSRGLFTANVHTIIYERLVENVASEVKPLIEWLELEWDDGLLDHTATAKSRGLITTASYSQVTEPIYRRASGRWLRYRAHLEPVFSRLAPWAKKFGYGDPRTEAGVG